MDASIVLNDGDALERLYVESIHKKSQFTGFTLTNKSFRGIPLYIENWFIMAPKRSVIMKAWLQEFERAIQTGFHAYKQEILHEGVHVESIYRSKDDVYLTMHACLQTILQKRMTHIPPMLLKPAENDMFRLLKVCEGQPLSCVMKNMRDHSEEVRSIPYIKLTKDMRDTKIDIRTYFL